MGCRCRGCRSWAATRWLMCRDLDRYRPFAWNAGERLLNKAQDRARIRPRSRSPSVIVLFIESGLIEVWMRAFSCQLAGIQAEKEGGQLWLTRDFKETIRARAVRDAKFRKGTSPRRH
jgi:hypothetical protein